MAPILDKNSVKDLRVTQIVGKLESKTRFQIRLQNLHLLFMSLLIAKFVSYFFQPNGSNFRLKQCKRP